MVIAVVKKVKLIKRIFTLDLLPEIYINQFINYIEGFMFLNLVLLGRARAI